MAKKLTSAKAKKILHDKSVHGKPLTDKQRRFFGAIAGGAEPYKAESGGWLDKYIPKAQNGIEGTMGGLTDKGFNYNGAWGGTMQTGGNLMPAMAGANQTVPMAQLGDSVKPITMQLAMGGSLPGAVGFTYARTINPAPSNGPYAKKTKASAQNGMEMKYYQEGLDFKPKTISKNGGWLDKYEKAQVGTEVPEYALRPMTGDIASRAPKLSEALAIREAKEKQDQAARTRTTIGADTRTAAQKKKDAQAAAARQKYEEEVLGRDFSMPSAEKTRNREEAERIIRNLVDVPLTAMGAAELAYLGGRGLAAAAPKVGEYLTTQTPLRNVNKINPFRFTPPEGMMYRGIGKEGMEDALQSGVFRSKQNVVPEYYPGTRLQINKSFGNPYFTPNFKTAESYGADYLAEVPRAAANWRNRYGRGKNWSQVADREIPIIEGRILKKDWLRGYKPVRVPEQSSSFKSEIDWAKWNPDTPKYPELINEYNAIEESTKKAGTWMTQPRDYSLFSEVDEINLKGLKDKLQKGELNSSQVELAQRMIPILENQKTQSTIFQGTPEQFIQQQSSHFKKAFPEGFEKTYRGTYGDMNTENLFKSYPEGRGIFTGDIKTAEHYAGDKGKVFELFHPKTGNSYNIDVKGRSWREVPTENLPGMESKKTFLGKPVADTDDIAKWAEKNNVDYVTMKNIFDGIDAKYSRIVNNKPGNFLKSTTGNVGFFDMTNPNIYKSLLPAILGGGAAAVVDKKQDGGDIPVDPMGYWNPENVGEPVIIPSNIITMEGVDQPLIGISDTGDIQYMEPGGEYEFEGESVLEMPVARGGVSVNNADAQPLKKLDQLLNFTNYNKPTRGGWLDKYK